MSATYGHSKEHTAIEALRLINQLYINQLLEGSNKEVNVRIELEKEVKAS